MALTHLLDTSAILVHFLGEPGAELVSDLLSRGSESVALPAPTWVELERRLAELIPDADEAHRVWKLYTQMLCSFLPINAAAAEAAIALRKSSPGRLPMVDALIAGCAKAHHLTLLHRDAHMAAIPQTALASMALPTDLT